MKSKIKKVLNMKYTPTIILVILIIVQALYMSLYFVNNKKGYHSDEIFSYGLSNSFYQPFIHSDNVNSSYDELQNINEWISGDILRNYITVQEDERFRYDSVWYNQENDRHPPLYYTVLHTLCSFFPDEFSPWFGFSLNLLFFVITQIFLYKLSRNLLKSKYLALIFCTLWGFSFGAVSITIFIRMYSMLTMWAVIFMYLHSKLYKTKEKPLLKQLIPIMLVTTCGTLTQHLFLFVAFVTAVCFCIRYGITKRWKEFFAYGFSVLGGVLFAWLIFPADISQLFTETGASVGSMFFTQFVLAIKYYLGYVFGIYLTQGTFIWLSMVVPAVMVCCIILLLPILFLFRKSEKLKKITLKIKNWFKNIPQKIKNFSFKCFMRNTVNVIKKSNPMTFIFFLSSIVVFALTAYTIDFMMMGYVDRYLFIVYPILTLAIILFVYFIITKWKYKKIIISILMMLLLVNGINKGSTQYTFEQSNEMDSIVELTSDSECIIVMSDISESWLINTFPNEIFEVNSVFMTNYNELEENMDKIEALETDKPVYLFFNFETIYTGKDGDEDLSFITGKTYNLTDLSEQFKELDFSNQMTYITDYTIYTRNYKIYRLA